MEQQTNKVNATLDGFSPVSTTRIHWNSRKRSASLSTLNNVKDDITPETPNKQEKKTTTQNDESMQEPTSNSVLSEKRKALFEPLEPIDGRRPSNESLLPPPDFDCTSYPRGWLAGKKRKLVNVDVVDTMRRIAIQEMNRKDREIDGLNEQLEEDSRCLEHLQLQLLEERSKRTEVEREKTLLQEQVSMLMNMLDENEDPEES